MKARVSIIGGLGHVGLPLGLFLAEHGHVVALQDIAGLATDRKLEALRAGRMPFIEAGADELVRKHWGKSVDVAYSGANEADVIIVCIGTPLDEYQNPRLEPVLNLARNELAGLKPDQLVILRSTVFPGTTEQVAALVRHPIAFCPERILQGSAIAELATLPQIISGTTTETADAARHFFEECGLRTVTVRPIEAELAKLFTNTFRIAQFGIANDFYRIGTELGADYARVHHAMTWEYPRCTVPVPGFAAGPCLVKDLGQVVASAPNGFPLGVAVRESTERLPDWLVRRLDIKPGMTVCIAGAAFKPENDDIRDSLSYRLKKLLEFRGATVLMTDPYVPGMMSLDEARAAADLTIIATPHAEYRTIPSGPSVVRIWEAA